MRVNICSDQIDISSIYTYYYQMHNYKVESMQIAVFRGTLSVETKCKVARI